MTGEIIYTEQLRSNKTEALFLALTLLFLALFAWRVSTRTLDLLAIGLFCFFALFLFYSLNYCTLVLTLTPRALVLKFGIFTWSVPLHNVAGCHLDELPALQRLGGAGIHFMLIRHRYRVSFNFLEYPRLVLALEEKRGPVQDVSFSTRQPEELRSLIEEATSVYDADLPSQTVG
jgi:Ca2+/Na+ antiporter